MAGDNLKRSFPMIVVSDSIAKPEGCGKLCDASLEVDDGAMLRFDCQVDSEPADTAVASQHWHR